MSIRKIIDPKHNGEKVWLKGHAQATFMSDGSTVEDAINNMKAEDGGITTETDPIFSASPAAKITDNNISSWNNKVDKVDGKQLSTEDFTTVLMNKLSGLNNYDDTAINQAVQSLQTQLDTLVSGNASTAIDSFNEIIAFLNGITDSQSLDSIIASIEQQIAGKMDKVTLAAVATSGNYNDLSNKPTIPSAVTESTVSGWGFTKNTGTYTKPSTGIPKSDLASAIQTSLGKADTALQSYTEQYKGTITGVSANGTSVATSGVANIPAASTSAYGVTKLSSSISSTSTTLAATASSVKAAYDLANGKQEKLVSGTNIKTINGESILGEGNIVVEGGSSSGGNEGSTCTIVNHNASDVSVTIQPNTFHIWGVLSENEYFFDTPIFSDENIMIQFTIGNTIPTLEFTYGLIWNTEPTFSANTVYQISITGSLAIVVSFDAIFDIDGSAMALGSEKKALYGQTWEEWVYSDYNTGGAEINSEGYLGIYDLGDDFVLAGDINTGALCKDTDKISPISSYADFII